MSRPTKAKPWIAFRMARAFATDYPWDIAKVFGLMLLSSAFEGLGVFTIVPLASIVVRDHQGSEPDAVSGVILSAVEQAGLEPSLGNLLAIFVGLLVLKALTLWFVHKTIGLIQAKIETDLRVQLMNNVIRADWPHLQAQASGHLANAVTTEATRAASNFAGVAKLAMTLVQTGVYTASALIINAYVAIVALVTAAVIFTLLSWYVRISRAGGTARTEQFQSLLARFTDLVRGLKPLKAMAKEHRIMPLIEADAERIRHALGREAVGRAGILSFQEPLGAAVLAAGLYVVLTYTDVQIGTVFALAFLFWRSVQATGGIQKTLQSLAINESAYWAIVSRTEQARNAREDHNISGRVVDRLEHRIRLDGIHFSYGDRPTISDVSIDIPAGRITAVIGPSGSGKTTLADLILGLFRPQQGRILIDGHDLRQINLLAWRQRIGYVPQEPVLLNGSIAENISLGDPDVSESDIEAALRQSGAMTFVDALPQGMHTVIGEEAQKLSGGQRQRLAIARALVSRPVLLILDEATSALDPETEHGICKTLVELRSFTTIFAISHQMAIRDIADQVFLLEAGGLRDDGGTTGGGATERPADTAAAGRTGNRQ